MKVEIWNGNVRSDRDGIGAVGIGHRHQELALVTLGDAPTKDAVEILEAKDWSTVTISRDEPRAATPPLRRVCAWCPGFDPTDPINRGASHTICEACAARLRAAEESHA